MTGGAYASPAGPASTLDPVVEARSLNAFAITFAEWFPTAETC
jgi:hypothetical protein